jgi:hypothetical protein
VDLAYGERKCKGWGPIKENKQTLTKNGCISLLVLTIIRKQRKVTQNSKLRRGGSELKADSAIMLKDDFAANFLDVGRPFDGSERDSDYQLNPKMLSFRVSLGPGETYP